MLKNRQDLIALREGCMAAAQLQKRRILVCAGTGCVSSGSLKIFDRLKELIEANGISCPVELKVEPHEPGIHGGECACHAQAENADNSIAMKKSGCHGFPLFASNPRDTSTPRFSFPIVKKSLKKQFSTTSPSTGLHISATAKSTGNRKKFPSTKTRPASFLNTAATLMHFPSRNISASAVTPLLKRLCST